MAAPKKKAGPGPGPSYRPSPAKARPAGPSYRPSSHPRNNGFDLGAFAHQVSTDYARGVAAVGRGVGESVDWAQHGLSGLGSFRQAKGFEGAIKTGTMPVKDNPVKRILKP